MKTEVYSWRVSSELKSDLERAARSRKVPVSSILDQAVRLWLDRQALAEPDEAKQQRLHAELQQFIGSISIGGGPYDAKKVREVIVQRVGKRIGRQNVRRSA